MQEARKAAGFEVSDRVEMTWRADGDNLSEALREARDTVAREVLATAVTESAGDTDAHRSRDDALGLTVWLRKAE